jgi:hypothetical protein
VALVIMDTEQETNRVSVEISLYPLQDDYLGPIRAFIERLNDYPDIQVLTNTMSTQVFGPYARVLGILAIEMARTHEEAPKAPFVLKVLAGDLSAQ